MMEKYTGDNMVDDSSYESICDIIDIECNHNKIRIITTIENANIDKK